MALTQLPFYSTQTGNYTLTASDDVVEFNITSGSTATLPSASSVPTRKRFIIRNYNTSTAIVTVNTSGGQTVDGRASGTMKLSPSDFAELVSDGSNWRTTIAQETVQLKAYISASQSITNGSTATVIWDTTVVDTHSAMNTSTGVYTAPLDGLYCISVHSQWAQAVYNAGGTLTLTTNGNRAVAYWDGLPATSGAGGTYLTAGTTYLPLLAGSTVIIQAANVNTGGNKSLQGGSTEVTHVCIHRIR